MKQLSGATVVATDDGLFVTFDNDTGWRIATSDMLSRRDDELAQAWRDALARQS